MRGNGRSSPRVAEPLCELADTGRHPLVAGALATFGVLGVVSWTFPNPLAGVGVLPGAVALWSVLIGIVALPHVLVGSVLDGERGIWYVP